MRTAFKKTAAILAIMSVTAWNPAPANETVTIKGSDTMVILNQRWAEAYMTDRTGVVIQVTGGGSGTGLSALINGSTDICASSRPIKEKEQKALQAKFGARAVETAVAKDGVAVYLNDANPVADLTVEQVRAIYTGKITNWKDVGGLDAKIILYSRENNSGTYVFFKEHMLDGADFTPVTQSLPGTAAVANAVARDKRGIGYGGAAYAKGIKYCGIRANAAAASYLPTEDNILSGKYPASRDLYFYTRKPPAGGLKAFVDWVLGPEGQKIVSQVGYFPLKK